MIRFPDSLHVISSLDSPMIGQLDRKTADLVKISAQEMIRDKIVPDSSLTEDCKKSVAHKMIVDPIRQAQGKRF